MPTTCHLVTRRYLECMTNNNSHPGNVKIKLGFNKGQFKLPLVRSIWFSRDTRSQRNRWTRLLQRETKNINSEILRDNDIIFFDERETKPFNIKLNVSSTSVKANSFKPTLCQGSPLRNTLRYNTLRTLRIYYTGPVACYKERLLSPVGALFLAVKNRRKDILFKCY